MSLIQEEVNSSFTDDRAPIDEKSQLTTPSDVIPPSYSPSSSTYKFATVSLHMFDRIRFLQFPPSEHSKLLEIVSSAWSNGIQTTREYAGSYEVQFKGNPWSHTSSGMTPNDNHSRRLMRLLLEGLYNMGWVFETAIRVCKKSSEKDTLLFTKHSNTKPLPPLHDWFMISYDNNDLITIQRAPQNFTQLLTPRINTIITVTNTTEDDANTVLNLKGGPWIAMGQETMKVRSILLAVRETLNECGWKLYANFRMFGGSDPDVLVCCRDGSVSEDQHSRRVEESEKEDLI